MANKIIHKHSSVVTDGQAKLPTIDQLDYGELAVNYADGVETISMKNSENEIVEFKSKEYFEEIIKENEFITAAALTELNEKIKEYEWEGEKTLTETITDLEQIVEDNGLITSAALNTLNKRIAAIEESGSGAIAEKLANIEKDIEDNEYVVATALSDLDVRIDENELITASALTQLNEKIKSLEDGNVGGLEDRLVSIETMVENNSLVAATALTDLDERTTLLDSRFKKQTNELNVKINDLTSGLKDNEYTIALAITNINQEINNCQTDVMKINDKHIEDVANLDEKVINLHNNISNRVDDLTSEIENSEYTIALAITDLNKRLESSTVTKGQSLVDTVSGYILDTPKVVINLTKYSSETLADLGLKEGGTLTLDCTTKHVEAPSQAYPFHINIGNKHVICKTSDGEYMTKYNYGALTGHHTFMYMGNCFVLVSDDMDNFVQINHGTNDTLFALTPNRFHVWDSVPTLNLSLKTPNMGVANEYLFQFTSTGEGTSLTLPYNVQWVNDAPPTIAPNMTYQISIVNGLATAFEYLKKEPNNNEIWYTSSDNNIVTPYSTSAFGANIISNTYENGLGVITFDAGVTTIGDRAFYQCSSLTEITIPDSVTSIGFQAFQYCESLTSITIPDSVTEIGERAFYQCSSLASVDLGNGVTSIGESAFQYCTSLNSVYCNSITPPAGGSFMFSNNASGHTIYVPMASVEVYKSAQFWSTYADAIEGWKFTANNIIYYISSDNNIVTPYSTSAFGANIISNTYENGLGVITFDADVTSIGTYAFNECSSLTEITIPDSVTSIGKYAFYYCRSLTSINIPDGVTSIGAHAFDYCSKLTEITIPDSVTEIGNRAFYNCTSLTSVYCQPTTPPKTNGSGMFSSNGSGRKIYVPMASVDAYKSAEYWSDYADAIEGKNF